MTRYGVVLRVAGLRGERPRDIRVEAQLPPDVVRPEAYISAGFADIWPDCEVLSVTEITDSPPEGECMSTRPTRQEAARAALALILTVLFDYAVIRRLVRQTSRQFARKWIVQLAASILAVLLTRAIRAIRS